MYFIHTVVLQLVSVSGESIGHCHLTIQDALDNINRKSNLERKSSNASITSDKSDSNM